MKITQKKLDIMIAIMAAIILLGLCVFVEYEESKNNHQYKSLNGMINLPIPQVSSIFQLDISQ